MRYFVVSDVHDHYDLMLKSLKENGFDENNNDHMLIVCGDVFYSGPQPGELYVYLKKLLDNHRFIFIKGNHDVELLDNFKSGIFKRPGNRTFAAMFVKYMTGEEKLDDGELIQKCKELGLVDFLEEAVWFYETDDYVFTHGFIPTSKHTYKQGWRDSSDKEWRAACTSDAMKLSMLYGISEPNKIIVCGHYSASRCYIMQNATSDDWENKLYKNVDKVLSDGYKTFYGKTFIALDGSVKKTGNVNCFTF